MTTPFAGHPASTSDPTTPRHDDRTHRRLSSAPQTSQIAARTPADSSQTGTQPRSVRRTPGAGRLRPKTVKSPHLNRAFEQRQALTPGRRKSGRGFYKDSPRDILRQMSRVLPAPTPQQRDPTPRRIQEYRPNLALYDDDPASPTLPPIKSNLSDSDDDIGPPPRSSIPLEADDTLDVTMELPLRAPAVRPDYGRESLGPRASDVHLFAPMSDPRDESNFLGGDVSVAFDESMHQLDPELTLLHAGDDASVLDEAVYDDNILGYQSENDEDMSHAPREDDDPWVDEPESVVRVHRSQKSRNPRVLRESVYGLEYAPFPSTIIRKLAAQLSSNKISKDTLRIVSEASDSFFRQASDSLRAFARHAGRRTIDDADVLQLMMRQRLISPQTSLFLLAQRHLPRELANEIRMRPKR